MTPCPASSWRGASGSMISVNRRPVSFPEVTSMVARLQSRPVGCCPGCSGGGWFEPSADGGCCGRTLTSAQSTVSTRTTLPDSV
jgi:hypothetical protein